MTSFDVVVQPVESATSSKVLSKLIPALELAVVAKGSLRLEAKIWKNCWVWDVLFNVGKF